MTEVRYVEGGDNHVLRSALYDAYKGRCWWCEQPKAYREVQIDHILPKTAKTERLRELTEDLGLDVYFDVHDPRNLGPICGPCNQEKSSTDFTRTPRIQSRLRKAERLRGRVIRIAETFGDSGALTSALLRAKEADLSDPKARQALQEHAPGLVQALANIGGFTIDYTDYRTIEVERGRDEPFEVVVALDGAGRRALTVLEDVCGADLTEALNEPLLSIESQIHRNVTGEFEAMEVVGGSTYPGPPVSSYLDLDLRSIAGSRSGSHFEFSFGGTFEAQLSASLMQDDKDPGTLEEVQGEAFVAGTFYFTAEWDPSEDDDLVVGEPSLEYEQSNIWTE